MEIHFQTKSGNNASHRGIQFVVGFPYSEGRVVGEKVGTAFGSKGEGGRWGWGHTTTEEGLFEVKRRQDLGMAGLCSNLRSSRPGLALRDPATEQIRAKEKTLLPFL